MLLSPCFDKLIHITAKAITLNNEKFVSIYIPRSKNDQLLQGNEVLVSRTGFKLCPGCNVGEVFETR